MIKNVLMVLALLFSVSIPVTAEEKPKIAFIILEENIDEKYTIVTESKLKKVFSEKGFIVEASVFKDNKINEFIVDDGLVEEGLIHDEKKIKDFVQKLKAEMVVIGKAVVKETGSESNNPVLYSVRISATLFATENMKVLGSSKVQAASYNSDAETGSLEALEKASSELAEDLVNQVLKKKVPKIE